MRRKKVWLHILLSIGMLVCMFCVERGMGEQAVLAAQGHTPVAYTLSKNFTLSGGDNSYNMYMSRRVVLYKGDTVTIEPNTDASSLPILEFVGIMLESTDGISIETSDVSEYEGAAADGSDLSAVTKFTVTSDYPLYFTYKGAHDSREYGSGNERKRYQYHRYSTFTFADSTLNLDYSLDGGIQKSDTPSTFDLNNTETVEFEAPVKKGYLLKTIYDEKGIFSYMPATEEGGYRAVIRMKLKDITSIDTRNFTSSSELSNITIKTTWKSEAGRGTVEYDANGGTIHGQPTYLCETNTVEGSSLLNTDIAPSREGYTFAGWYADAEGTGETITYVTDGEKMEDLPHYTVYAKWEELGCDHKYQTYTTPATMKANGLQEVRCTLCGDVESSTVIKKVSTVKLATVEYVYDGKGKSPTVTLKDSTGTALVKKTDYTVTLPDGRKNVGKYTCKITFKGKYSGTKSLSFTILPKGTTIKKLTAVKKGFTVTWAKQTTQTTGYQIQYSTSRKFTSPKNVTIAKNTTLSKSITKLTKGKKYYVRVRTYKTVGSAKFYSGWSGAKYITAK